MLLGDYGADVIKVEEPHSGDGTRSWGPPWVGDQSAYFLAANRNKRSLTVNLKAPEGVAIVRRLAAQSDVLIENFKPGTLARLGLGYSDLAAHHPGLIYCSLTGYGQTGPYRDRPGYDFVVQAQGGLMSITGPVDGEPYKAGVAIADITTGLFAATAILAALHARTHSGHGQSIDVALLDAQVAWLANVGQNYLATGVPPGRYGNAHPSIVPYETFPTADGPIALAIGTDEQFRKFCLQIARADLCDDERFRTNAARVANRAILIPLLQDIFRTAPAAAWIDLLLAIGVPAGPINDVAAALDDPHVRARGMVQRVEHPTEGPIDLLGPVANFSRTPADIRFGPPPLGYDTRSILRDLLDYTPEAIERLYAEGVI
jgi:crotonobetainyl-CoA:carnitine CoA-transferase CaiB-like acyl-CoA transferase